MAYTPTGGERSTVNSSTAVLTAGSTFTGAGEFNGHNDVLVSVKTDQDGTLYMEFSPDGSNWDSSISFSVSAGVNEIHKLIKGTRYYRTRFTNTSSSAQTYFRLTTSYGSFGVLTSSINSVVQQDADAQTVRSLTADIFLPEGKLSGYSIINKFGRNSDIDTADLPEDTWNGGGVYAGFPVNTMEELEFTSSNAGDVGVVTFTYLSSASALAWQSASVNISGTSLVRSGVTAWRVHTAQFAHASTATGFNLGTITCRHRTSTGNVFFAMPIGRSQTNTANYTVPFGSTGYIKRMFGRVIGSQTATIDGALWVREIGKSPRLRRPFTATNTAFFEETPYGGLVIPALSDIQIRVSNTNSANNVDFIGGFDLVLVKG